MGKEKMDIQATKVTLEMTDGSKIETKNFTCFVVDEDEGTIQEHQCLHITGQGAYELARILNRSSMDLLLGLMKDVDSAKKN